jgi:hypothetical protein
MFKGSWASFIRKKHTICKECLRPSLKKEIQERILNSPEVGLLQKKIGIKWHEKTAAFFIKKGYVFTKYSDSFVVNLADLPSGSNLKIKNICPLCRKEKETPFYEIMKKRHTFCHSCKLKTPSLNPIVNDLTGLKFSRLTVLQRVPNYGKGGINFSYFCRCDCGNEIKVQRTQLIRGTTKSCGCYKIDLLRSKRGAQSPHWKKSKTPEERISRRAIIEIKEWAIAVKKRDFYTCDFCGVKGGKLCSHHLNSYACFPAQRTDILNGITLCKEHHLLFHFIYGNNVREKHYLEFKEQYNPFLLWFMVQTYRVILFGNILRGFLKEC